MSDARDSLMVTPDLHCSCYRLRKAARQATTLYDAALKPLGLTITQMNVLAMIGTGGARPISAIAEALGMDASTLSRTLRPLVSRGVVSIAHGADRRVRELALTASGTKLIGEAVPLWRAAQARVEKALGGDVMRLHDTLARLGARLGEEPDR
jgi:DNA-binding MarR family transcriptional regulator